MVTKSADGATSNGMPGKGRRKHSEVGRSMEKWSSQLTGSTMVLSPGMVHWKKATTMSLIPSRRKSHVPHVKTIVRLSATASNAHIQVQ